MKVTKNIVISTALIALTVIVGCKPAKAGVIEDLNNMAIQGREQTLVELETVLGILESISEELEGCKGDRLNEDNAVSCLEAVNRGLETQAYVGSLTEKLKMYDRLIKNAK